MGLQNWIADKNKHNREQCKTWVDVIRGSCAGKLENLLRNVGYSDVMVGNLASGKGSCAALSLKIFRALGILPEVNLKCIVGIRVPYKKRTGVKQVVKA